MQDLLDTERWWEPYRARAAEVIGPRGPLATHNLPVPTLEVPTRLQSAVGARTRGDSFRDRR